MNAAPLPHVTEVLRDAGLVNLEWCTEEHRDRGTAVHLATRFHDEDDLDRDSLEPTVQVRLASYERFLREVGAEIVPDAIERYVESLTFGYCGTFDRLVRIKGVLGILDIKGTAKSAWHGAQLAAYQAAHPQHNGEPVRQRWNLYLHDDDYRLVERNDRDDWPVFKAALTLTNWKRRNAA